MRRPNSVTSEEIQAFRFLVERFADNSLRRFPWRDTEVTPYQYTLTEIFLQQTRAETVNEFYYPFFERYSDWNSLNNASLQGLADYLRPLGLYNQRAERIKNLATLISEGMVLPVRYEELIKLPGIGMYVASAIATRFGGECHPMLDVNVARILARYFNLTLRVDIRKDKELRNLARNIVSGQNCLSINWALLDIGGLYCTSRRPNHELCILKQNCLYALSLQDTSF